MEALSSPFGELDPRSSSPLEVARDGSSELFAQVRQRILLPGGLLFFAKGICGFPDLTAHTHGAVSRFYEDDSIKSKLVEFPKSHLKTTLGTVAKSVHIFAKHAVREEDLSTRLALASNTKSNSKRFLRLVKELVASSYLLQTFFPEIIPEFGNETVWNADEIIFPRSGSYTDPSIDTIGVGGASTSRHYTFIICDDMLDEEDEDSPTAVKKAIELYQYYTSLLVDDDSNILTNEHAWNGYDLNMHIIENEPHTAVFSVGASRGFNPERSRLVPEAIVELTKVWEGQGCVWPERYGPAALARRRASAGARIFNAVYENDPYDPDVVDFKEGWIRYFEWTKDGDIRILPSAGIEMEVVKRKELQVVGCYDPALSKKTTADRSAVVIVGVDPKERVFMLESYAIREDPLVVLDKVLELTHKWTVQRMGIETVLFQKVLLDMLRDRVWAWNETHERKDHLFTGIFCEVKPPRGKNKEARIRSLIGTSFEGGRVYLHPSHSNFVDEYLHFPLGRTVDLLDAFTYTAELWTPGISEDDYDEFLRQEQMFLARRDAVTGY